MNWLQENINTIVLGDSYELIKNIPDKSIDLIITDPPYCVGVSSNGTKSDFTDFNMIKPFFDYMFMEMERTLKTTGFIYVNCDWRTYPIFYELMYKNFLIKNCIVWDYEWIKAGNFYRYSHEFILFATSKENNSKRNFSASERDVWRIKPINFTKKGERFHQAQKPEELIRKMILNSSNEKDIVADFFCGSGTTPVVAKQKNRKFIAIEINENTYDIAIQRLNGITANGQTSIFTDFNALEE